MNRSGPELEFGLAGGFSLSVLVPFLMFVLLGWPGCVDPCVDDSAEGTDNSCYCEAFDPEEIGQPGVRQPFNTWSNLYALFTGAFLAGMIYFNRRAGLPQGSNRISRCLLLL